MSLAGRLTRRTVSTVRSEADAVGRQAEERRDDEAAKPPSNPVGRANLFRYTRRMHEDAVSDSANAVDPYSLEVVCSADV